jgi:hypothetical protein
MEMYEYEQDGTNDYGVYKRELFVTVLTSCLLEKMHDKPAKFIVNRVKNLADELELQGEASWTAEWNILQRFPPMMPPDSDNTGIEGVF